MAKKPKVKVYFEKNRNGEFKRIHVYKDRDREDTTLGFWVKLPDKTMVKVGEFIFTEEMELHDNPEPEPEPEPEPSEPKAPVIDVGENEFIEGNVGEEVTMAVKVTDPNGNETIKDIVWKQTLGPSQITDLQISPDKWTATFKTDVDGDYLFTVTATDDTGLESSQGVNVKIRKIVEPEPEPVGEFTPVIAAFGDSNSSSTAATTFSKMNAIPNIKIAGLGDYEYDSDFNDFKNKYATLKPKTVVAAKGNHDDDESESSSIETANNTYWGWKDPATGKAIVGNIGIVLIDTQADAAGQKAFVEATLKEFATANLDWKIAVFHKPFYSPKSKHSEERAAREVFAPLFKQYGVSVTFAGHNHNQWLSKPIEGTVYVGSGNAGRDIYQIDSNPEYIEWSQDNDFGYVVVEQKTDKTQLKIKFINNAGQILRETLINRPGTPQPEPEPEPQPEPEPEPEPIPAGVIYDSAVNSKLHDGIVRTVEKEGNISAGGLGVECRASGNPRIVVNADKTFSLKCDAGHGRFYLYCLNYNSTLEIEAAFWNAASGQDMSLKARSRHNEGGDGPNRFGGYGLAIDRSGWGAKRETFHNEHDQSTSGSLPSKPETGKYFKLEFTVKDENGKVRQIGKYNGTQFMSKTDSSPLGYMTNQALYEKQSYFWVRSNIDSGTGELRIKRIRVIKL